MSIALVMIATGEKYHKYIDPLLNSAAKFFIRHIPILWTDSKVFHPALIVDALDTGYPDATLYRYHTFLKEKKLLSLFEYIFYCDIDMLFVSQVKEGDILSLGVTATLHPGFAANRIHPEYGYTSTVGTPERHPESTAYIPRSARNQYFCGGFNGGTSEAYLKMAEQIKKNIDVDRGNGVTAIWHDESHLNRYLFDNPPAKILTPSFCYPEDYNGGYGWPAVKYPPVLVALDKRKI